MNLNGQYLIKNLYMDIVMEIVSSKFQKSAIPQSDRIKANIKMRKEVIFQASIKDQCPV